MKTVNVTLTWEEILPYLLAIYSNDSVEDREFAFDELSRLARIADSAAAAATAAKVKEPT